MLDTSRSNAVEAVATAKKPGRLTPADRSPELAPWRRAQELGRCSLYWMPVSGFPVPLAQRVWLLQFLERLASTLSELIGLRREVFLQLKTVPELMDTYLRNAQGFQPILGLSRRPGMAIPRVPDTATLNRMAEAGEEIKFSEIAPDYCYWFLRKSGAKQLEAFWGHGGISIIFTKPDPATTPPPLPFSDTFRKKWKGIEESGVDGLWEAAFALKDGFQAKSKELFGIGLEDEPQYPGLPFILPLLQTSDFFSQLEPESAKWFQLFNVYLRESPEDSGILLASKTDLDDTLIELLAKMRADGFTYTPSR